MLLKIALRNVRRSIRDYAVYFVTIVLGVAIFYAFNSIEEQSVLLDLQNQASGELLGLTSQLMGSFSLAIAAVLGFLVVYANGFLIKRRRKEFGTYLLLGMGTRRVSAIIVLESLIVGLVSAAVGLAVGYLASQGLSFVTAALLDETIRQYHFVFSPEAFTLTLLCFGAAFLITALFNVISINKTSLVNLLSSHAGQEKITMRNPAICVVLFAAAVALLVWAYQTLEHNQLVNLDGEFAQATLLMVAGTFLLFWSISGFAMLILQRTSLWKRGTFAFTSRQVANRMNVASVSMTVISVMLFFAMTTFSTGMGLAQVLGGNVNKVTQFDVTVEHPCIDFEDEPDDADLLQKSRDMREKYNGDAAKVFRSIDSATWDSNVKQSATLQTYTAAGFNAAKMVEQAGVDPAGLESYNLYADSRMQFQRLSEFNQTLTLVGKEPLKLAQDEYIVNNTVSASQDLADALGKQQSPLKLGNVSLTCADVICQETQTSALSSVACVLILPDEAVDTLLSQDVLIPSSAVTNIQYIGDRTSGDKAILPLLEKAQKKYGDLLWPCGINYSGADMAAQAGGLRMLIVYLAIYIGFVFLIACAALLAIRQLCDAADSLPRYRTLAKLGCETRQVLGSLRHQTELYFLAPLAVACAHTAWAIHVMNLALFPATGFDVGGSVALAALLVIAIYGSYLVITYLTSKNLVRQGLE